MKTFLSFFLLAFPIFSQTLGGYIVVNTACGVVGDKITDDTAALQACINAAPDYAELVFPAGLQMKITAALNLHGRYGIRFLGETSIFAGPSANTAAPTFYWYGPDGGTMLDINRSQNFLIEGLTFMSSDNFKTGTGGASIGIYITQTLSTGPITTDGILERVSIYGTEQNPGFRAIVFSEGSNQNVENMTVRNSVVSCSYGTGFQTALGQGIVLAGTQNAQGHTYERNTITNCATGIYIAGPGGSPLSILRNNFNSNGTHIYSATTYAPVVIEGSDSENCSYFFQGTGQLQFSNNRVAACSPPSGKGVFAFGATGQVVFTNNKIEGNVMPFSADSYVFIVDFANSYGANPATMAASRVAIKSGSINTLSAMGFLSTGGSQLGRFGSGSGQGPVAGLGLLDYSKELNRWASSQNGSNWVPLATDPSPGITLTAQGAMPSCGAWLDLQSNGHQEVSSASRPFTPADVGGVLHLSSGVNFVPADYIVTRYFNSGTVSLIQDPSTNFQANGFSGSFTLNRGRIIRVEGTSGVADTLMICQKTMADVYAWVALQ